MGNPLPWYHRGLKFQCTGCGDCCTGAPGYVWVNKKEIQTMAEALGITISVFEEHFVRRVGVRKSLIERPNGDCIFFSGKQRNCRVYEARPLQCRTFPFWTSNLRSEKAWKELSAHCPGCNRGPLFSCRKIESQRRKKTV
ncbi:MAG: YkgJ family cysteine cluster protein [Pirellulales bacterium]|nr:YkgJ family cysteine cluster protein [Pirellulales bacterium]